MRIADRGLSLTIFLLPPASRLPSLAFHLSPANRLLHLASHLSPLASRLPPPASRLLPLSQPPLASRLLPRSRLSPLASSLSRSPLSSFFAFRHSPLASLLLLASHSPNASCFSLASRLASCLSPSYWPVASTFQPLCLALLTCDLPVMLRTSYILHVPCKALGWVGGWLLVNAHVKQPSGLYCVSSK
jgi:hypothetical protein